MAFCHYRERGSAAPTLGLPQPHAGRAAGGCREWAGVACSGDGTDSGGIQAAVMRRGKAHFRFKAQPKRLQVSPALTALQSRCVMGSWSIPLSLCRCRCSARQPRCFSQLPEPPASSRCPQAGGSYPAPNTPSLGAGFGHCISSGDSERRRGSLQPT